jgi:hypothetical protein
MKNHAQHSVPENHRDNAPEPQQPRRRSAGAKNAGACGGGQRVFRQVARLGVDSIR